MFLKMVMQYGLRMDTYCPGTQIWSRDSEKVLTMSPKLYKRFIRLQKSPLLKVMYAEP